MIVGGTISPCCCDQDGGDCGDLVHASAPATVSVSGGFTSTVYNRTLPECAPGCGSYDASVCCDYITELNLGFQGVLQKTSAASWTSATARVLYANWVEFSWTIGQTIVEGGCSGRTPHSESGGAIYGAPVADLPYCRIVCCRTSSSGFGCATALSDLCTPLGSGAGSPDTIATLPYLVLQFYTESANQGVATSSPSRPSYPWQGLEQRWPQVGSEVAFGPSPLAYLTPSPGSTQTNFTFNWFRPSQMFFGKNGGSVFGSYTPARSANHPTQWSVPGTFDACDVYPISGSGTPCSPPADYRFAGVITGAFASIG